MRLIYCYIERFRNIQNQGVLFSNDFWCQYKNTRLLIEEADAAVVMEGAPFAFGCVGCERSNLMVKYLLQRRGIPVVTVNYPENEEEGKLVVAKIKEFLDKLNDKREVD